MAHFADTKQKTEDKLNKMTHGISLSLRYVAVQASVLSSVEFSFKLVLCDGDAIFLATFQVIGILQRVTSLFGTYLATFLGLKRS